MKNGIVADESLDFEVINQLRLNGIFVISILEAYSGANDVEVLSIAQREGLLLITEDKDFGELAYRQKHEHNGIMLIRLAHIPRQERIKIIVRSIIKYKSKMDGAFSVLSSSGLRIKDSSL